MRPLRLSIALLLLLISTLAVAQQTQPRPSASDGEKWRVDSFRFKPGLRTEPIHPTTGCLKMRSYIFARENPRSDAMTLVGTTTCTPAWKFSFKTADLRPSLPLAPDQQPAAEGDSPRRQSQERGGTPTAGAADHQQ